MTLVAGEVMMEEQFDTDAPPPIAANGSGCENSCNFLDELGPPPDLILTMPPPPLPSFLQHMLLENFTMGNLEDGNCNFCHLFGGNGVDSEFTLPKPDVKSSDAWLGLVIASVLVCTLVGAFLVVFIVKCRKWKMFPSGK